VDHGPAHLELLPLIILSLPGALAVVVVQEDILVAVAALEALGRGTDLLLLQGQPTQ
jgi:hypothetical protein